MEGGIAVAYTDTLAWRRLEATGDRRGTEFGKKGARVACGNCTVARHLSLGRKVWGRNEGARGRALSKRAVITFGFFWGGGGWELGTSASFSLKTKTNIFKKEEII